MTHPAQPMSAECSLRICVITQQLGSVISGIGLHARNLISHLVEDRHRVWVVAPADQRPAGILSYQFYEVPKPLLPNNQARWFSLSLSFTRALRRLESEQTFNILHFTDARESLFVRSKTPAVGNLNDTYSAEIQPLWIYKKYYHDWLLRWSYYHLVHAAERTALPRLQAILANSDYTAQCALVAYPLPRERVHVIHKSIELRQYAPALEIRRQLPPHPPRVLFVGGNMQRKGLPTLIQAAPRLITSFPDLEFWIVGKDPAIPKMQSLCKRLGVDNRFRFLGGQSHADLVNLYAQADVFALPSLTEAFGVVFLEAMAAGLPVVGTRAGGVTEIIRDQENGLLVPPDHPHDLAEAILHILSDSVLQQRLRQAGLETTGEFTVDRMMEQTVSVYKMVVGG